MGTHIRPFLYRVGGGGGGPKGPLFDPHCRGSCAIGQGTLSLLFCPSGRTSILSLFIHKRLDFLVATNQVNYASMCYC